MRRLCAVLVAFSVFSFSLFAVSAEPEDPEEAPVDQPGEAVNIEVSDAAAEPGTSELPADPDAVQPSDSSEAPEEGEEAGPEKEITIQAETVIIQPAAEEPEEDISLFSASSHLQGGYYMQAQTNLGSVTIYVPSNFKKGCFTYDQNNQPVNITASTISGYLYRGSGLYNVRFASMGGNTYRLYNSSSSSWSNLSFTSVGDTNIQFLTFDPPLIEPEELFPYILVFCLGVMILCQFIKRF